MAQLPDFKTILYATDIGEHTRPVFRNALSIAQKFDSRIIMIHVVEPMSSAMRAVVDTYLPAGDAKKIHKDGMREVLTKMKERLQTFCEEELNTHNLESVHVKELLVVSGKTSEEIIRAAENHHADLIIIGKSTRVILGGDVSGSTARRISRHATIPVMIVPNN